MDAFRISLIVVGITVLLGIYLFDSNKKIRIYIKNIQFKQFFAKFKKNVTDDYSREPEINEDSEILENIEHMDGIVAHPYSEAVLAEEEKKIIELTNEISVATGEEMVVVFFIIPHGDHHFSGVDINAVCTLNGFEFTDKNIYEKFSDTNMKDRRPIASIVNSFEPGVFDANFEKFNTKAITIILFLPGPDAELDAFEDIVVRAKSIAKKLNAELCDETRSVLTQQTISHIEEKIEAFQFKNKMLSASQHR